MAYFDKIKVGDRVWSFEFGWGEVVEIWNLPEFKLNHFDVVFEIINDFNKPLKETYDKNGKRRKNYLQTLFKKEIVIRR